MKHFEYKTLELMCDNTIENDWINKLNLFLSQEANYGYKLLSVLFQGTDNKRSYWKTLLLEKELQ